MMTTPDHDALHRSVRRLLLKRLALVVVGLAIAMAALVVFIERDRMGQAVISRAEIGVARFNAQVAPVLDVAGGPDGQALQNALDAFAAINVNQRSGRFAMVRIRDLEGTELARFVGEEHAGSRAVSTYNVGSSSSGASAGAERFRLVRLEGDPYVHVDLPLLRTDGSTTAHIEGLFAVSAQAIADVRWRMARAVAIAVGIVLLTLGIAYPIIRSLLARISHLTGNLLDSNLETLQVLGSAIAKRDHDTDAHNYRVTVYSVRLAEVAGLGGRVIRSLVKGAFLHDVGKIGIRDRILLKPGKLDEDEFEIMKTHVQHGIEIAERCVWLADAAQVVGNHHEKYGGRGYPSGIGGREIPVAARVFAIADVFDALTSRRPYKEPFSFEQTMQMLEEGRDGHFDPELLDHFGTIARPLYDQYAGGDEDGPRREMQVIIQRYFKSDVADLFISDGTGSPPSAAV